MKRISAFIVGVAALVSVSWAESEVPDVSKLDRDTLEVLVVQLYARIDALEAQLGDVQAVAEEPEAASWRVRVVSNTPVDVSTLKRRIEAEREKLPGINQRLTAAQERVIEMEAAKDTYFEDGRRKTRSRYSSSDLRAPKATVRGLERDKRTVDLAVRRLQREIDEAAATREIVAQLVDDGTGVQMIARGVYHGLAESMRAGKVYEVSGRESSVAGVTVIDLRSVAEVEQPAAEAQVELVRSEVDEGPPPPPDDDNDETPVPQWDPK